MNTLFAAITLGLIASSCANASGNWREPERGSPERGQIMDALRTKLSEFDPAAKELIFVVKSLCVSANTGWLTVDPRSRDGKNQLETTSETLKREKTGWRVDRLACSEAECEKGTDATALKARIQPRC